MPMEWHPETLCRRLQTVLPTGYNRINLQAELTFTLIFNGNNLPDKQPFLER